MPPERRGSVVDVALQGGRAETGDALTRAKILDRLRLGDTIFRNLTRGAAILVLLILGGVIVALITGAWPALRAFSDTVTAAALLGASFGRRLPRWM